MKKNLIFRLIAILCVSLYFINASGFFAQAQRGMKIVVRTTTGQDIPLYNKSYALVVGNGNYTNGWDPLYGALRDVKEVAAALEKHGFKVTLKTDLNKTGFEDAFETFLRNGRDKNSRLLFYYAGHGYTETLTTREKLGYLVMVDSPPPLAGKIDGRKNVDMEYLVTQAKRIDALHVLYMLDSCFSGSVLNARNIPQPPAIQDSVKYPVRQFITAGRANEPVPDYSMFKVAFLDLLAGRAAEPIPDGYITGEELGLYLKNEVSKYNPAQTPQYGKINDPNLNKGDFVFVLPSGLLSVNSKPSGAQVTLDGVLQSRRTPITIQNVKTGTHMLTLTLQGYEEHRQQTTVKAGKLVTINPTLKWLQPHGSIFVNSKPSGAQVALDGVLQARPTPIRIQNVMAGTYMLGLTLRDYEEHQQQITVKAGKLVTINPRLTRLQSPHVPKRGGSKLPLIIGGGLAAVGAGVALFILSENDDNAGGNGQINQPQTGRLTISISVP